MTLLYKVKPTNKLERNEMDYCIYRAYTEVWRLDDKVVSRQKTNMYMIV